MRRHKFYYVTHLKYYSRPNYDLIKFKFKDLLIIIMENDKKIK